MKIIYINVCNTCVCI